MFEKHQLEHITGINKEEELREQLLIPLFKKMGYEVESTCGPGEKGKDLVLTQTDKLGRKEWIGVVVKVGDITGAASGKGSIVVVSNQVDSAIKTSYEDPKTRKPQYMAKVLIITNGRYSNMAKRQILDRFENKGAVDFFNGEDLLSLVKKYWPDYFRDKDPFIFEYYRRLEKKFRQITEWRTFGYSEKRRDILEIFIEPDIVEEKVEGRPKTSKEILTDPYERYKCDDLLSLKKNVFLVGNPGSGKSTVLRRLGLQLIRQNIRQGIRRNIPIYINFREVTSFKDIKEGLYTELEKYNLLDYVIDIDNDLAQGKVILFLDGLDELPTDNERDEAVRKVRDFSENYRRTKIIFTSRNIDFVKDWDSLGLKRFKRLELLALNYDQIKKFISRWFVNAPAIKQQMLESVEDSAIMEKLPKTPLVLTLIAMIFEDERRYKEIPANLTELYDMFTELFLGRWDLERSVQNLYRYNIKDIILTNLAYMMHNQEIEEISEKDTVDFIKDFLDERGISYNSGELLNEILERSRLLFKNDRNNLQFAHLSFQEYFTGKKFDRSNLDERILIENFIDTWWENVAFYYFGLKKDCPDLLNRVIKEVPDKDFKDKIKKIMNLGYVLQASYFTKNSVKLATLEYALNKIVEALHDFVKLSKKHPNEMFSKIPRFFVLLVFREIIARSYGSVTLLPAIQELFKEKKVIMEDTSQENFRSLFQKYCIVHMLFNLGQEEALITFLKEDKPKDVSILAMLGIDIHMTMRSKKLEKQTELKQIETGIKRKMKRNFKLLLSDLKKPVSKLS